MCVVYEHVKAVYGEVLARLYVEILSVIRFAILLTNARV